MSFSHASTPTRYLLGIYYYMWRELVRKLTVLDSSLQSKNTPVAFAEMTKPQSHRIESHTRMNSTSDVRKVSKVNHTTNSGCLSSLLYRNVSGNGISNVTSSRSSKSCSQTIKKGFGAIERS